MRAKRFLSGFLTAVMLLTMYAFSLPAMAQVTVDASTTQYGVTRTVEHGVATTVTQTRTTVSGYGTYYVAQIEPELDGMPLASVIVNIVGTGSANAEIAQTKAVLSPDENGVIPNETYSSNVSIIQKKNWDMNLDISDTVKNYAGEDTVYLYGYSDNLEVPVTITTTYEKDSGLRYYYPMDSLADEGLTFTDTATVSEEGKVGKAVYLNGGYATTNHKFPLTKNFTFSAWVKPDSLDDWARVFDFGYDQNAYVFLTLNSGSNIPKVAVKTWGTEEGLASSTAISAAEWTYIAVTMDGTEAKLYLNGSEVASGTVSLDLTNLTPSSPNYIGKSHFASDALYKGLIDEVKIYNYALSADEIREDYKIAEPTPVITKGYSTGTLDGFTSGVAYTVSYKTSTDENSETITETIESAYASENIKDAWYGKTVSVVKTGNGTTTKDSEPYSVEIEAQNDAPTVTVTGASNENAADGSISGLNTATMQQSADGIIWTDVTSETISGLASTDKYYFRYKPSESSFASKTCVAEIGMKDQITATFVDDDGNVLSTQKVSPGTMPSFEGTPSKSATAKYTYTFKGWQPELAAISEDTTFTAQFDSKVNKYIITWKDYDGTELGTTEVEYDAIPSHDDVSREQDAQYIYSFDKWTPTLVAVTGDAEYTASYTSTPRTYNIYFSSDKGTVPEAETYTFGTTKTLPIMADTDDYHFAGWKLDNTGDIVTEISADTTGDKSYTAYWIAIDDAYKMLSDSNLMFNIDDYHEDNGTNDTSKLTASSADGGAGWSTAVFNEAVSKNSFTFDNAPVHYLGLTNYDITMSEGYGKNSPWTAFRFRCASNSGADFMLYDIDGNAIHGSNYAKSSEGYYIGHGERWTTNDFAKQDNALIDDTVNGNDVTRLKNYLKSELVNSTSLTTGHFNYSENPTDDIVTIVIQNHESGTVSDIPDYVTNSENSSSKDKISEGTYTGDYYTVKTFKNNVLISTEYYSGYRNGIRYFRHINTWSANYYGDLKIYGLRQETKPAAVANYATGKLTGLAEGSYTIDCEDTTVIREVAEGDDIEIDDSWYGKTISIVKDGNGISTCASESQSLDISARYTVAFNTDGGSEVDIQKVVDGEKAARPVANPAKANYDFDDWYISADGDEKFDFTTSITKDTTVYAHWTAKTYSVTVRAGLENGSVAVNKSTASLDDAITVTISPETGYQLASLTVGGEAVTGDALTNAINSNSYTFNMPAKAVEVSATFAKKAVDKVEITLDNSTATHGTAATINATAKVYAADNTDITSLYASDIVWSLDDATTTGGKTTISDNGASATVSVGVEQAVGTVTVTATVGGKSDNKEITVSSEPTYTITIGRSITGGTVTTTPSGSTTKGQTVTITATPDDGYQLKADSVKVNGGAVTVTNNTFTMPESNVTVTAEFEQINYTITDNTNDAHGLLTISKKEGLHYGDSQAITIVPAQGYELDTLTIDGVDVTASVNNNSYTIENITGNVTIAAIFKEIPVTAYTVIITGGEGIENVKLGEKTGTKDGNTYTFTEVEAGEYSFDVTYTEGYEKTAASPASITVSESKESETIFAQKKKYTVTFKIDGQADTEVQVEHGSTAQSQSPQNPTKSSYHFVGWVKGTDTTEAIITTWDAITSNGTVYTAKFEENAPDTVTVTFNAGDGTFDNAAKTKTVTINKGALLTANDLPAVTPPTGYTFNGWGEITGKDVNESVSYTAEYTIKSFTITWMLDENTKIDDTTVDYNVTPTHADASKPATDEYTYTFKGWTPDIVAAMGNVTYTAQFDSVKRKYTITWSIDGAETNEELEYGATPSHANPTKAEDASGKYSFKGWSPTVETVSKAQTYTAQFDLIAKYTITYETDGGTINDSSYATVYYAGEGATLPTDVTKDGYTFAGWYDNDEYEGEAVTTISTAETGNKTYYANWTLNAPTEYLITFVNWDNTELQKSKVAVGTKPEYTGTTPTKPSDSRYTYEFRGWTPVIVPVSGIATYKAEFKQYVKPVNNKATIKKETDTNGTKLIVTPNDNTITVINLYTAIYNTDNSLKRVEMTRCTKDGDDIIVPLTEPQLTDGETYKLMLWDISYSPLIQAITSNDSFFN